MKINYQTVGTYTLILSNLFTPSHAFAKAGGVDLIESTSTASNSIVLSESNTSIPQVMQDTLNVQEITKKFNPFTSYNITVKGYGTVNISSSAMEALVNVYNEVKDKPDLKTERIPDTAEKSLSSGINELVTTDNVQAPTFFRIPKNEEVITFSSQLYQGIIDTLRAEGKIH